MRRFASLILCATLPLAAGFAVSSTALAQGMQYDGPGAMAAGAEPSAMPNPLPVESAPIQRGIPMPAASAPAMMAAPAAPGDMTRMAALEQQVRDLTNQIEQRDFQIRQLQSSFDKYVADTNQRLQALESRGPAPADQSSQYPDVPPQPVPPAQPGAGSAMPENPASNNPGVSGGLTDPNGAFQPKTTPQLGQITGPNGAATNNGAVTSGQPQGSGPVSAAKAYDQAFSYLQQSNYDDAQRAFSDFLKTYPTHPLAANAKYWLGEAYFAQTQYSMAAKTFAKAFQDHPQGQKAPDALLKLAMTLDKMNKRADACLTLGELTKRFPSGPASVLRRGQEESTRMNCGNGAG